MRRGWLVFMCIALRWLQAESLPEWDAAKETVVLYNLEAEGAADLAKVYARGRGVPENQVIGLQCTTDEIISREDFSGSIVRPLTTLFLQQGWFRAAMMDTVELNSREKRQMLTVLEQKIRVLAIIKGMPLKVQRATANPSPSKEDEASVDSELSIIGLPVLGIAGGVPNPYFGKKHRFSEQKDGMLLVGRLDANSEGTVKRMIGDALAVEEQGLLGRAVIDLAQKTGAYKEGEDWLRRSAVTFRKAGIPVAVDRGTALFPHGWPLPDTALYFGWYEGDITGALKQESFRFARGAVACHLHSFSASTLRYGDRNWCGPLLERGAAVTMGNVWEPYLSYTVHFDIFNDMLLQGYTVAEAAWAACPALSWMNVLVGDPLYRPFANQSLGKEGAARDYALYRGIVSRHSGDGRSSALKADLLKLATQRNSGHLMELMALLADLENKPAEAAKLLDNAAALHTEPSSQLRCVILQLEMLGREGSTTAKSQRKEVKAAAVKKHKDQTSLSAPAHELYQSLLSTADG
jgi:uncharacterized protein (TIGR03790 family)